MVGLLLLSGCEVVVGELTLAVGDVFRRVGLNPTGMDGDWGVVGELSGDGRVMVR